MRPDSAAASSRSGPENVNRPPVSTTPLCRVRSARNNQRSGSACRGPLPCRPCGAAFPELIDVDSRQLRSGVANALASGSGSRRARREAGERRLLGAVTYYCTDYSTPGAPRTGDPAWLWHTRGSGNRGVPSPRSPWDGWINPSNNSVSDTAAPPLYLCVHYCHQPNEAGINL